MAGYVRGWQTQDSWEPTPDQKRPGMRQNTLCQPEIDQECGGTHSADQKLTQNVAEHTLLTKNWPGKWRNTL